MLKEVPYIAKMSTSAGFLRMSFVDEDGPDVDLSPKYFSKQMSRRVDKGIETILIHVAANESPLVAQAHKSRVHSHDSEKPPSKRRLDSTETFC